MGKLIGISKEQRLLARKYASRFKIHTHKLIVRRKKGVRFIHFIGTDENDLEYDIRFDKIEKMNRPTGMQITNKIRYLTYQGNLTHGKGKYDYSLVLEDNIKVGIKLPIICSIHGIFYKRKASHITDGEGCPKCSANRLKNNRKYFNENNK